MLRLLIGIVTGLVCGSLASTFLSSIVAAVYPVPANFDITDIKMATDYFRNMPNPVRFVSLAGIMLGAFTAGVVAAKIAMPEGDKMARKATVLTGFGMLLFQTIIFSFQSAQPWWYHFVSLAAVVPLAMLGGHIIRRGSQN